MEKKPGIDDAISAVSVHGVIGIWGVLSVRLFAVAYPFFTGSGPVAAISLTGHAIGTGVMFSVGFVPGYIISLVLMTMGILHIGENNEVS